MGLYQSFQQVFVTNAPALLPEGQTVDALAVGQVGFLDAKTYRAVTAPTYGKNKAIVGVWGTPDVDLGDFGSAPNENEYTKIIKGKLIKRFRAKSAQRPQTPLYTLGWSGDVADTNTLTFKVGESANLFIQLTGTVVTRLQDKTGVSRQFKTIPDCVDDCTDTCGLVNPVQPTLDLVRQINSDKFLKQYIRAKALISGLDAPTVTNCYRFILSVCDTGDAAALGAVQSQYPDDKVTFLSRSGAISTYVVIKDANVAPADFTSTVSFVPDCPECPDGSTLVPEARVYQVRTASSVLVAAVQGAFTGDTSVTLLNSDPQFKTWLVTFPTTTADSAVQAEATTAGYVAQFIGIQNNICVGDTPVEVAWVADGTLDKQSRTFRISLADSVCGTTRLADLQAAYPDLTITLVDAGGTCVHTFETTVEGPCYEPDCGVEDVQVKAPDPFEGALWSEVPAVIDPEGTYKTGILFETSFFHKATSDCSFDAFPYENDVVYIQASKYDPDFNSATCVDEWVFKQIRGVKFPQGHGDYVRRMEQKSKMYDHRYRSTNSVVREQEGYSLQANPAKYYDEYVLEFDTKWKSAGGWSEDYTQSFSLHIFVPEGTGQPIENALNSYITSAGIEEDGAAI